MAITTIIAGCDLSPPSDAALDRAIAIAELHKARIVIVHAQADDAPIKEVDNEMLAQIGEVSAAVRVVEARGLSERMAMIQARGLAVELVSRVGPAGEVLTAAATEYSAELIVVGTQGHTGITRFLLGSTAAATIRQATCDVLVCRGGEGKAAFQRPLVATDFSATSAKTLAHTTTVCAPGVTIHVIHAWQLPAGSWGASLLGQARFPWNTVRDAVLDSAKAQADKLSAEHAALGHPLNVELVQGPPASVITESAEKAGNDLIAVGAHGHRGVRRLLLGSVAEDTIRHSPCSVLVVHGDPEVKPES
ncbi:MAG: universal stress protein [Kofleriaceae bacterium]